MDLDLDLVNKPSSLQGIKCEVLLSFRRGEDTPESFPSCLYSSLRKAGISVLKDEISIELLGSIIEGSEISIIIFSEHYASSRRCLEELTKIVEFRRAYGQVVLPIFYGVEPFEVRNQKYIFGRAFQNLIQRISPTEDEVSRWRIALNEVGGISGFIVPIFEPRNESEKVQEVVEHVCNILDKKDLFVAGHPVGVDNRVQEMITMLKNHQPEDVVMVGIWGMGGVGKTTIAKAIYNKIGHTFESRSYLSNIREVWDQEEGPMLLQSQLLSEIFKTTKIKINSVELGKIALRGRLRHKKTLIVFDDVDKLDQLNALAGRHDWFKPGSTIIITTRDRHLLLLMGCRVYMMKNLDKRESIELFSWHAFKKESPKEDFTELSREIVAYSGGLPLALEVLGSYLFNRQVVEWKSLLDKLKKIPNGEIQKKLKISFDGLSDDLEKEIFLDICCFFIGKDRNRVTQILNGCEFFADIGIRTLVERSLVTIDKKNKLGMHDLLRDMGREIIREQSLKELGERSRLWFHEDALAVLSEHLGTKAIEGLSLKLSQGEKVHIQTEAFKKMKRLRLLRLHNVQLTGDYKYISRELRWLCWHGFPLKYIPSSFYQKKLVVVEFKYSSLKRVWKEPLVLERLKILNLSHSPYLVQTPDFSGLPNLEKLILKDCRSLSMIHPSIEFHHKLLLLDLENCIGLHSLPRNIYKLKCLKTLILSGCENIKKLEEDIEQMESLTTLVAPALRRVPYSLVRLRSISCLSVCGRQGLSNHVIPSLYRSWMSPTNNPLPLIPSHAVRPSFLSCNMPNSINGLLTIPGTVPEQQSVLLKGGLETPDSLSVTNCMDISRLNYLNHLLIQIGKKSQVFCILSKKISQGFTKYGGDCIFLGDNYPYWLTFKGEGTSVSFKVPSVIGRDLKGMIICCGYIPSGDLGNKACESVMVSLMIINYTKAAVFHYAAEKIKSLKEGEKIISNLERGDQVEMITVLGNGLIVKKTGVYLIYDEPFDEQMEPSPSEAVTLTGTKHKCEEEEAHQSTRPRKAVNI